VFALLKDDYEHNEERALLQRMAMKLSASTSSSWSIMEASGDHTRIFLEYGLDKLLPEKLRLLHGPGCPVAGLPLWLLDHAINICRLPDVIFCAPKELLRIPASQCDLLEVKAEGYDLRVVYSLLDCLSIARANPSKQVVFFNAGFAAGVQMDALGVWQARRFGVKNFSLLSYHCHLPAILGQILSQGDRHVDALLAPGHICSIWGYRDFEELAEEFQMPVAITGFEPADILEGMRNCVLMLEAGKFGVENQYKRACKRGGDPEARALINEVFELGLRQWRGLGNVPASGFKLRKEFESFDAFRLFPCEMIESHCAHECISSLICSGLKKPNECALFGRSCKPDTPLGSLMVSSQGACAAYYKFTNVN
jgi:hydrogenase expression/formation protein HypD